MGIPDHLTCLLRNLYAGQDATVRIGHEKQNIVLDMNNMNMVPNGKRNMTRLYIVTLLI